MEFLTLACGGLKFCYAGLMYMKKADKKIGLGGSAQKGRQNCKGAVATNLQV